MLTRQDHEDDAISREGCVTTIENSQELTGYRVRVASYGSFRVRGYTLVTPPSKHGETPIQRFWDTLIADGRLAKLIQASSPPAWILGVGSWDPECPEGGQRYTVGIEETEDTDFSRLAAEHELFTKPIGASTWLCFETSLGEQFPARFWKDNPYRMMEPLGYRFHRGPEGDYSVGLHIEAYPPDLSFGSGENRAMEFWITVEKA